MTQGTLSPAQRSGLSTNRILIANRLTRAQELDRAIGCADSRKMRTLLAGIGPRTGRPRKIPLRTIAILLALHAIRTGSDMIVSKIAQTAADLTPSERWKIGFPRGVDATDKRVRSGIRKLICRAHEGVHVPHNHPEADIVTGEVIDCPDECPHLEARLDAIVTDIVQASIPEAYRQQLPTAIALDGTDAESHYRQRRPDASTPAGQKWDCFDKEVGLGKRTPTDRRKTEFYVGHEVHIATYLPTDECPELPTLAAGLAVRPGVKDRVGAAMAIIDQLGNITEVLADMAYTTAKPERWARPLRSRGISNTKDLHTSQRGVRPGPVTGTVWLDGLLYSAAIPDELRKLDPPKPGDTGTNKARRREQFDRRRKYAFVPLAKPDPGTDSQRFKGPARAGRLRCRNVPESMRRESGTRPLTSCQRGTDCGCGVTVTISATAKERHRQPLLWQTTDWAMVWNRRTRIEGLNGIVRYLDLNMNRGYIRCKGTSATALLTAFGLAGMNVRRLHKWHTTRGLTDPWCLALGEDPDQRPLDHYYRTNQRKRRKVRRD